MSALIFKKTITNESFENELVFRYKIYSSSGFEGGRRCRGIRYGKRR